MEICLSLLMDCAFENGYIVIDNDYTICVKWERIGDDHVLGEHFKNYDGKKIKTPIIGAPKPEYLERRRKYILSTT